MKIKNSQLTKATGLDKLKKKLAQAGSDVKPTEKPVKKNTAKIVPSSNEAVATDSAHRRIRAKNRSSFVSETDVSMSPAPQPEVLAVEESTIDPVQQQEEVSSITEPSAPTIKEADSFVVEEEIKEAEPQILENNEPQPEPVVEEPQPEEVVVPVSLKTEPKSVVSIKTRFGPTGKHINHLLAKTYEAPEKSAAKSNDKERQNKEDKASAKKSPSHNKTNQIHNEAQSANTPANTRPTSPQPRKDGHKKAGADKERSRKFDDHVKAFTGRDRYGLNDSSDEDRWRKKRVQKSKVYHEEHVVQRPTHISVPLPITIKDLAAEMKLKASELIQKLFIHGMTYVVNDVLDNETIVEFIGLEFGCTIEIDHSEKDKLCLVENTIQEEIATFDPKDLEPRAPIVAFMGHVDHGKTTLIDVLRKSNRVATEAGAITQHVGAFRCSTPVGDITILDTPGHEAFSAMRARGADVCDIVVLVVAGDEGIKEQTLEAVEHARAANITIVVAINKSDKPNFNADTIYRQLAEINLLPEAWGGTIATVNTSAKTGEGISELLEMLALQAEVLELKAAPSARARGIVIESELHKGLGFVATVLVQNGTLHLSDALVFDHCSGKVKTMHNEHHQTMTEALPSYPVLITGLSAMPKAGDSFIVVKNEKTAKEIIEARLAGQLRVLAAQKKRPNFDSVLQNKKTLKLIIKADVQGSIEALASSILNILSEKVSVDILSHGVGEISESDIRLAAASKAVIVGFHTDIESHAESLIKSLGVRIELFDVIYHAIDKIKEMMTDLLDPIAEEKNLGTAEIKETFKSSNLGTIYGCLVTEGVITRNQKIRVLRDGEVLWKGSLSSLKRLKDDVKEVRKGLECGVLLEGYQNAQRGDILQCFEVIYHPQKL